MRQLVLPFEDLLADDMERSLLLPYWGLDWGMEAKLRLWPKSNSYANALLGEWRDREGTRDLFLSQYDVELYQALTSTTPWTQLWLPLTAGFFRFSQGVDDTTKALVENRIERLRMENGLKPLLYETDYLAELMLS